ncbi:hypothetical protein [Providencia vermicola]|uniref:hypothetical protein n=1 Tax=Providencia vermicola TaxID=333965 RepID=UPI002FE425D4
MSRELSLNKVSSRSASTLKNGSSKESYDRGNVYDIELAVIKRKREEAIRKIANDSRLLKW